jgi:hypothetical protein
VSIESTRRSLDAVIGNSAQLTHVVRTRYGTMGMILLPIVDLEMFDSLERTTAAAVKGVVRAVEGGAHVVSGTGMIPAATRGLCAVQADPAIPSSVALTTGHETVAAAFLLNAAKACRLADRLLDDELVTVVGLGHIGTAVASLIIAAGYRPAALRLVDIQPKLAHLEEVREQLRELGYPRDIGLVTVEPSSPLPHHVYASTSLLLSASSQPRIIDVARLLPGTIVVDDSFPLGFRASDAIARCDGPGDILVTIAGGLTGPDALAIEPVFPEGSAFLRSQCELVVAAGFADDRSLTACAYSSMLNRALDLPFRLGKVAVPDVVKHYRRYREAGFDGTSLYIINFDSDEPVDTRRRSYVLRPSTIESFRARFSTRPHHDHQIMQR